MPELGPYGSVRGARGNSRPYRESGGAVVQTGAIDPIETSSRIAHLRLIGRPCHRSRVFGIQSLLATQAAEDEMDVIEAIHRCRSVRSYEPKPVGRELIESLIWDAAQAPPPFRGQNPWTFNVVQGAQRIAAYGVPAMDCARDHHRGEPGWDWLQRPDFKIFWDAPALIIISGPVGDCSRAGQNPMLSAHARGLGTCWVGSPMLWLNTPEVKDELSIPAALTPIAVLCLGYPAAAPEASIRERPSIIWVPEIAAPEQ
jgi:nitroreductase